MDTSKAELYLGSMIHDRSLIVVTGGGGIKQMYGYHRRLVRDFCEYRFQGGRWEEVRDSHNLWSCSRSVWAILCSFPLHCCSCKLTVHNERKGCEAERERRETKEHRVHGKHGVNKAWSCPFERSKKPHCIVNWPAISNTDTIRKEACETLLLWSLMKLFFFWLMAAYLMKLKHYCDKLFHQDDLIAWRDS